MPQKRPQVRALPWIALLIAAIALVATPVASAKSNKGKHKHKQAVGAVYTETNGTGSTTNDNELVVFARYSDGSLKQKQVVPTGGKGGHQDQPGCNNCPFLDTQSEVVVTPNGKLVFAVNAGSNTVSSFRVGKHGHVTQVDQESSNGTFPQSVTVHNGLLYVLNANSGNISGLRYSHSGNLTPIAGSTQPITPGGPPGFGSRQIGFNRNGHVLAVTLLATGQIDTFVVDSSGKAGPATAHPSQNQGPFGFAFDKHNTLVNTELGNLTGAPPGHVATYHVSNSGGVTDIQSLTESNAEAAPCWVVITKSGRFAFVVNSGPAPPLGPPGQTPVITRYKLSPSGRLTRLGTLADTNDTADTDEALSRNSRFLYVLALDLGSSPPVGHIDEYRVTSKGGLKQIGTTPSNLPPGISGIAAR